MKKLEIKWMQGKVSAIELEQSTHCAGSACSFGEIFRGHEGTHRTRLIVISGQNGLKANVARVQRLAA